MYNFAFALQIALVVCFHSVMQLRLRIFSSLARFLPETIYLNKFAMQPSQNNMNEFFNMMSRKDITSTDNREKINLVSG